MTGVLSSVGGWQVGFDRSEWPVSGGSPSSEITAVEESEIGSRYGSYFKRFLEGVVCSSISWASTENAVVDAHASWEQNPLFLPGISEIFDWHWSIAPAIGINFGEKRDNLDEPRSYGVLPLSSVWIGRSDVCDFLPKLTDVFWRYGSGSDEERDERLNQHQSWTKYLNSELERFAFKPDSIPTPIDISVLMQVSTEATTLLPKSMPKPAVVPTPDGTVELEWRKSRMHLRIAFYGTSAYVWVDNLDSGEFLQGSLEQCRELVWDVASRMSES